MNMDNIIMDKRDFLMKLDKFGINPSKETKKYLNKNKEIVLEKISDETIKMMADCFKKKMKKGDKKIVKMCMYPDSFWENTGRKGGRYRYDNDYQFPETENNE